MDNWIARRSCAAPLPLVRHTSMVRLLFLLLVALAVASCADEAARPEPDPPATSSTTTSSSTPEVVVPDVVGESLEDAQARLRSVGLETGSDDHEPAAPGGKVTEQVPTPGERVAAGESVTLYTR